MVKLGDFHETPQLQTKLNELLDKNLITMDTPIPQNEPVETDKLDKIITSLDVLSQHIGNMTSYAFRSFKHRVNGRNC